MAEMTVPTAVRPGRVVVVLGMHRSGTSLVARAVGTLGVPLGDNLWGPREEDNPTGFWEDRDVVELDKQLLERAGVAWNSLVLPEARSWTAAGFQDLRERALAIVRERLSRHGSWAFKDPRAARVLPFWDDVLRASGADVSYVLTVRHPVNVAASLEHRDGLPPLHSHLLWIEHVCRALADTAGSRRCFVDYDELVERPVEQVRRLAGALGLEITPGLAAEIDGFAASFVEDGLRHHRAAPGAAHAFVPAPALALHEALREVALGRGAEDVVAGAAREAESSLAGMRPVCEALDHAERRLATARDDIVDREYWVGELRRQIDQLREEKGKVEQLARDHGARLQEFYAEIERLRDAYERTARELAVDRAALAVDRAELSRIKKHWYWYVARLIIR
jgi:hypothetical protein